MRLTTHHRGDLIYADREAFHPLLLPMPSYRKTILILALAAAGRVCGQPLANPAANVTEEQVQRYQKNLHAGCVERGIERGHDAKKVNAFCDCTSRVLSQSVSFHEWQKAAYASMGSDTASEEEIILKPYAAQLKSCKAEER